MQHWFPNHYRTTDINITVVTKKENERHMYIPAKKKQLQLRRIQIIKETQKTGEHFISRLMLEIDWDLTAYSAQ